MPAPPPGSGGHADGSGPGKPDRSSKTVDNGRNVGVGGRWHRGCAFGRRRGLPDDRNRRRRGAA
ncbi:MAG: hypothetical protein AVDCRST_MAG59-1153 [uncultured Thermomicrobiales bacterium]|uniref:Uncharacterized protein n=1 Tax=uncultured Thermomicrobiales bacterium TaxID=1645740 RepID=A0A6J4UB24_9BACT|nr:MAG: hypothetical protein AVDCRST_MAG59-1153 [uncultured Thermomicrobiales bacterium]